MRQTGRSSRIAEYATEQLFNVGTCIVTDHIVYEFPGLSYKYLDPLVKKVHTNVVTQSGGRFKIKHTYLKVDDLSYVKLQLIPYNKNYEKNIDKLLET